MHVEGTWNVTMETLLGRQQFVWAIEQAESAYKGRMIARSGPSDLVGVQVDGSAVSFQTTVKSAVGELHLTFSGVVAGDTISGTCMTAYGENTFAGERAAVD